MTHAYINILLYISVVEVKFNPWKPIINQNDKVNKTGGTLYVNDIFYEPVLFFLFLIYNLHLRYTSCQGDQKTHSDSELCVCVPFILNAYIYMSKRRQFHDHTVYGYNVFFLRLYVGSFLTFRIDRCTTNTRGLAIGWDYSIMI